MFNTLKGWFDRSNPDAESLYMQEQNISLDADKGYVVDGIVLNHELSERLEYFSNRKLNSFDNLEQLYLKSMLINEKIDLEIATGNYLKRLNNNEENLKQFKHLIEKLNQYYRMFKRDK